MIGLAVIAIIIILTIMEIKKYSKEDEIQIINDNNFFGVPNSKTQSAIKEKEKSEK